MIHCLNNELRSKSSIQYWLQHQRNNLFLSKALGKVMSLIFLENAGTPSSTLRFITQIFHQENFNIPFIPNLVVVLSFVSLLINRSGLWSIFIAKYNPNLLEAIVGNGPSQFNNYLYKLKFSYVSSLAKFIL